MARKWIQALEGSGENALTWFFLGLMLIAVIAVLLGQMDID